MSGRSAYVRKEKTKTKEGAGNAIGSDHGSEKTPSLIGEFPMPMSANGHQMSFQQDVVYRTANDYSTIRTGGSGGSGEREDLAYARVRKPVVPALDISGIEKSSFRSMMDKKSEGVRKGLAKTFGKKKKAEEARPPTSATVRPGSHEMDLGEYTYQPVAANTSTRQQQLTNSQEYMRQAPQGQLPALPNQSSQPPLLRWVGSGRPGQVWNKLRKDPELWDNTGDTLVYFSHDSHRSSRPPPSFRLSSHIIENTDSRYLNDMLQAGYIDNGYSNDYNMPPSPISSPIMRSGYRSHGRAHQVTPPMSDDAYEGAISYELSFPAPNLQSRTETVRHQATTRNVFALLYGASLVGYNLYQALVDLHERLEEYMPPDQDAAAMIIEYLVARGMDDVRNEPSAAASLLSWCEGQAVRWEAGWKEAFVHAAGMYNRLEGCLDYKFITPISRALLERSSLEITVRVHNAQDRLIDWDFGDMWPMMTSHPPPARAAFERLRSFVLHHYKSAFENWPPAAVGEVWLTRDLARTLQKDFGALYDYLVNRDVVWDCSEERSGRKWNIIHPGNKGFDSDTDDLPFTDILVAFDNRNKFPHIPHPYPLTPEIMVSKSSSRENLLKSSSKRSGKPVEDKMAERRAALAYTESTNIYLLSSDFASNDLVEAFVKFEKNDRAGDNDLFAARRGRWVLIYGILQSLASVSVDTPNLRYKAGVNYHLSPGMRGTPPWKGANQNVEEATHVDSHCWRVRETWNIEPIITMPRIKPLNVGRSNPASISGSDNSSVRSPTMNSMVKSPTFSSTSTRSRRNHRLTKESEATSYSGYSPGIEKLNEEWPIRQHTSTRDSSRSRPEKNFNIKDFDDYHF
ncbi:hypothetical protein B0J14DRAFT_564142 [Halenospora varia]|nr:hypothetical protein B0J14DRAFT_564142 [Halenospora varia]